MIPSMFQWWGELFPYTNFHELNLDWIIRVLKTMSEKLPEDFKILTDDINTKLQKATNEGQIGDLLTSNGDGTSTWKPFDTVVADIIDIAKSEKNDPCFPALVDATDADLADFGSYKCKNLLVFDKSAEEVIYSIFNKTDVSKSNPDKIYIITN